MKERSAFTGELRPRNFSSHTRSWAGTYHFSVQAALSGAILLTLVMNGSVSAPFTQIAFLALSLTLLLMLPVPIANPDTQRALQITLLTAICAAIWGGLQSVPIPLSWLAHPLWSEVAPDLGIDVEFISAVPARTWRALPMLILPILVFAAVLVLCQTVEAAKRFWLWLTGIGLAILGLSILLEAFFPDLYFFSSYQVGWGAFSGVFVSRNVSASFFGLTAFALLGTIYILNADRKSSRSTKRASDRVGASYKGGTSRKVELGAALSLQSFALWLTLFATLIAIFLTRSRAGTLLALSLVVLTLVTVEFMIVRNQDKIRHRRLGPWSRFAVVLGVGATLLAVFGEPVLSRLEGDLVDQRTCAWLATWRAYLDRPLTGTGFGTFAEVFPSYRDAECLGTQGRWLRAHNSFLEFLMGFGVPALIMLLLGYGLLGRMLLTGVRRRKSLRAIPVVTFGALIFMSGHSLVDFPLQIPGVAVFFAALMGAGCSISVSERVARRKIRRKTAPFSTPEGT